MENICIRFAGMDENSGALFLQFSQPENIALIDQSTIHSFFPHQYNTDKIEELLPHMAAFGHSVLTQELAHQSEYKFNEQQVADYQQWMGLNKTVEVDMDKLALPSAQGDQYSLDTKNNPNAQVDNLRCTILEILAEEGLIPGSVK